MKMGGPMEGVRRFCKKFFVVTFRIKHMNIMSHSLQSTCEMMNSNLSTAREFRPGRRINSKTNFHRSQRNRWRRIAITFLPIFNTTRLPWKCSCRTYFLGFQSLTNFCACSICCGVIRFSSKLTWSVAFSCPCKADRLYHLRANTGSYGTPDPSACIIPK